MEIDKDTLRKAAEAATPGPWESDTERNTDAEYGSGDDTATGFDAYKIMDAKGMTLFDSLNRDHSSIEEESSELGIDAWDELARKDASYIAAANPATVIGLLDEIDALVADKARLIEENERLARWAGKHTLERDKEVSDKAALEKSLASSDREVARLIVGRAVLVVALKTARNELDAECHAGIIGQIDAALAAVGAT